MKHIVDNVNKLELTFKTIDLEGRIPGTDSIEFLSVEEPYREGRRYSPFVRVRYALNGVKQDKAFPLDVDKGIFLSIDDVLEERLRPIAPKIVEILQEHSGQQNVERRDSIRMTLKEHIDDIRNQLKQGAFADEAAVSNGIVNRLLHTLEWPIFTPQVVIPEFGVEGQRVDFALCHPASTPRVFIEVKRVGNIDKGIKQLFEYAFHTGVPIVILTDGQKWRFYHPAGEGSYEDRMVEELDIIVENSEECAKSLNRYLNYKAVQTGDAAEVIVEDYKSIVNQRKIEERLPEVWGELVQEKNENLLQVVMEKAKEKVGYEPKEELVLTFLKSLKRETESERKEVSSRPESNSPSVEPTPSPIKENSPKKPLQFKRIRVTMSDGEVIERKNGLTTFIEVIEKLGIERVKDLNLIRNTIPLISTSKDPAHAQHQLGDYYIVKRMSTKNKKRILDRIAKELEIDLEVELVDKV
ncbi:MAG: type I restriction endonuclease [Candidatus Poribacteria bacterium]|nr:type I restriction endonuclease [Candidatus Poribacteria bacterium]